MWSWSRCPDVVEVEVSRSDEPHPARAISPAADSAPSRRPAGRRGRCPLAARLMFPTIGRWTCPHVGIRARCRQNSLTLTYALTYPRGPDRPVGAGTPPGGAMAVVEQSAVPGDDRGPGRAPAPAGRSDRAARLSGDPALLPPNYKWIALFISTLGMLMATIDGSIVLIAPPGHLPRHRTRPPPAGQHGSICCG